MFSLLLLDSDPVTRSLYCIYCEGIIPHVPVLLCLSPAGLTPHGGTNAHTRSCTPQVSALDRWRAAGRDRSTGTKQDLHSGWTEATTGGARGQLGAG